MVISSQTEEYKPKNYWEINLSISVIQKKVEQILEDSKSVFVTKRIGDLLLILKRICTNGVVNYINVNYNNRIKK